MFFLLLSEWTKLWLMVIHSAVHRLFFYPCNYCIYGKEHVWITLLGMSCIVSPRKITLILLVSLLRSLYCLIVDYLGCRKRGDAPWLHSATHRLFFYPCNYCIYGKEFEWFALLEMSCIICPSKIALILLASLLRSFYWLIIDSSSCRKRGDDPWPPMWWHSVSIALMLDTIYPRLVYKRKI